MWVCPKCESTVPGDKSLDGLCPGCLLNLGLAPLKGEAMPETSSGSFIGHYRIDARLGCGGMGEVWRAIDTKLGREVAIKILPDSLADCPDRLARFTGEARMLAALNHPNIATIYDVGELEGRAFLVMELLEGKTLSEFIGRKPVEIQETIMLSIQIAEALDEAHSKGIIHRDIKPANIFVTARGRIKVLDFGVARRTERSDFAGSLAPTLQAFTMPGLVMGTMEYMSPEQARGEPTDARTDLFSFGVVLYEMATGLSPFRGAAAALVFDALLNQDPVPVSDLNPNLPPGLPEMINKALKKDRRERYQTASEMLGDLRDLEHDWALGPRPAMNSQRSIRILCVEDHPVFREGLCRIIGAQQDMLLVAQAANATEAVNHFRLYRPDVTLMDLRLPGANGTDAMIAIRGEFPEARIIVLTTAEGDAEIQRALRAGACAYILKNTARDELLSVIRSVHAGNRRVPAEVATRVAEHLGDDELTTRELDVLRYIRDGSKTKEIAANLNISETTVHSHIKNVVRKLQAKDRAHAVTIAVRRGILHV
ncbi:MAG: protein kinase [Deltaproteobacteria bacterium]|nr:protein kinase [Deltaproteobacteria bacterium]